MINALQQFIKVEITVKKPMLFGLLAMLLAGGAYAETVSYTHLTLPTSDLV